MPEKRGKNASTTTSAAKTQKEMELKVREREAFSYLKKIDPLLHAAALPHRGAILSRVQPKRTSTELFQALSSSIVSQQLSTKAAESIYARLSSLAGGILTPTAVLSLTPAELRSAGLSHAKIKTLIELSNAICSGALTLLSLKRLPSEEAIVRLTSIWGIGPWTAEMFLIFALGAPDVFSPGDLILARIAQELYALPPAASKKDLALLAERWSPHRSFVSLLFWQIQHAKRT